MGLESGGVYRGGGWMEERKVFKREFWGFLILLNEVFYFIGYFIKRNIKVFILILMGLFNV